MATPGGNTNAKIILSLDPRKFISGSKQVFREANKLNKTFAAQQDMLRGIRMKSAVAFAAMGAAAAAALAPTIAIEREVSKALTLVDDTGDSFTQLKDKMTKDADEMSRKLGISGAKVASTYYQVLSAGADATKEEFTALTETALKLGTVTGLSLPDAVETLADVTNAFKMELKDVDITANQLITTAKLTATTIPQLREALREAAPVAAVLDQRMSTTNAVLAGFAKTGNKASVAGTAFKMILSRLGGTIPDVTAALNKTNLQVFDNAGNMRNFIDIIADLKDATADMTTQQRQQIVLAIGGRLAFSKLAAIMSLSTEELKAWESRIENSTSLQQAWNVHLQSFDGQMGLLKSSAESLATSVGQVLLPQLLGLMSSIKDATDEWRPFIRENAKLIAILIGGGLAGAGLLGALSTVGLMLMGLPALFAAVATPVGGLALVFLGTFGLIATMTAFNERAAASTTILDAWRGEQKKVTDQLESLNNQMLDSKVAVEELKSRVVSLKAGVAAGGEAQAGYERALALTSKELELAEQRHRELEDAQKDQLKVQEQLTEAKLNDLIVQTEARIADLTLQQEALNARIEYMGPTSEREFDRVVRMAGQTETELKAANAALIEMTTLLTDLRNTTAGEGDSSFMGPLQDPNNMFVTPAGEMPAPGAFDQPNALPWLNPDQQAEDKALLDAWKVETDAYYEGLKKGEDDYAEKVDEQRTRVEKLINKQTNAAVSAGIGFASAWSNSFRSVLAAERGFANAFGTATVLGTFNVLEQVIKAYTAQVIAFKIKEIGKATMGAPMSFGATLAAIGPIVAGASVALAGLSAIKSKFADKNNVRSFETGGVLPETGMFMGHKGEVVYNPAKNSGADLARFMGQAGAGGVGGITLNVDGNVYGMEDVKALLDEALGVWSVRMAMR